MEAAEAGLEPGGVEVPPRSIKQMVSVRFEPELIVRLRQVAESRGLSVSDLVREAAARLVDEAERQRVHLRVAPSGDVEFHIAPRADVSYWDGHSMHSETGRALVG